MELDIFKDVPKRCRNCPVLARFSMLLANSDQWIENDQVHTLKLLDQVEKLDGPEVSFAREMTRERAEHIARTTPYELKDKYEEAADFIKHYVDDQCPGPKRGTGEGGFLGAVVYVMGEKSCQNPNFAHLVNDEVISVQLKMGNWHPVQQD